MHMGHSAGIEDLLSPLKKRMQDLEEENQLLRAQLTQARQELTDLRRGIGIVVYIDGKPVAAGGASLPDVDGAANIPFTTAAVINERHPANLHAPMNPPASNIPHLFQGAAKQPGVMANTNGGGGRDTQPARGNGYVDFFVE